MSAFDFLTSRVYAETLEFPSVETRAKSASMFRQGLGSIEMAADFLTCAGAMAASFWFARFLSIARPSLREMAGVCISVAILAVLSNRRNGTHSGGGSLLQIRQTEGAIRRPVQSVAVLLPITFTLGLRASTEALLVGMAVIPSILMGQKHGFSALIRSLQRKERGVSRAAIYGVGNAGMRILSALMHSHRLGVLPVVVINDDPAIAAQSSLPPMGYRRRRSVPVHSGPITSTLLKSYECGTLIVVVPNLSQEQIAAAADAANRAGARTAFLVATELQEQLWTTAIDVDGLLLTPLLEPFDFWHYTFAKRALDVVGSSLLLLLLSPLFLLIALLIRLDSEGPAFFSQERVGRKGQLFRMYKFRSMHAGTPGYEPSPTAPHDPRLTRIGRLLRGASLDELPQLMNVLLGNMSLVGPRPEMPFIAQTYTSEQRQRLQVMPGITGLWQLSADRALPIHENIQYDLYYVRNRTFFMDVAILIHTLFFAVHGGV